MRALALFCFVFLSPSVYCKVKVIKFYGTITYNEVRDGMIYSHYRTQVAAENCFMYPDCVAVSDCPNDPACRVHHSSFEQQLTLNEPQSGDKSFVVIRTFLPDDSPDCPNNYTDIDFKYPNEDGMLHSWKKISGVRKFESCKQTWQRSERADGKVVCLKALNLTQGVSKEAAQLACQTLNTKLVGMSSVKESVWMRDAVTSVINGQADSFFWLSGKRASECVLTSSWAYKKNMAWDDTITDTRDALTEENTEMNCKTDDGKDKSCFAIMNKVGERVKSITDVPCEGSGEVMQGAICGYELYK